MAPAHRLARTRTGAEAARELSFAIGDLVAGRYVVTELLGGSQGAFSTALQALDTATRSLVCLKVIKNVKDYVDQSLDEVRLLRLANAADPDDSAGILRLLDAFYHREHLFLVTEALRADLHAVARAAARSAAVARASGSPAPARPPYFTLPRIQAIARQVLHALAFLHGLGILHCDVKPENVLLKSYSRCEVKLIDLGSSCLASDPPAGYVQSRAYRAPEVVLGAGTGPPSTSGRSGAWWRSWWRGGCCCHRLQRLGCWPALRGCGGPCRRPCGPGGGTHTGTTRRRARSWSGTGGRAPWRGSSPNAPAWPRACRGPTRSACPSWTPS